MRVETPVGTWHIEGTLNPFGEGLIVQPPGTGQRHQIAEDPVKTGRSLMAHLLTAQPVLQESDGVGKQSMVEVEEASGRKLVL